MSEKNDNEIIGALLDDEMHEKRGRYARRTKTDKGTDYGSTARGIANRVRIAEASLNNTPQAVLKITGNCISGEHLSAHLFYLARERKPEKERLQLETEAGQIIHGKQTLRDIANEWAVDFDPVKTQTPKVKITLQIPGYADAVTDEAQKVAFIEFKQSLTELLNRHMPGNPCRIDKGRSKKLGQKLVITLGESGGELPATEQLESLFADQPGIVFGDKRSANYIEKAKIRSNRETFNFVISAPAGSNPKSLNTAARNFAGEVFGTINHRYVFVLHTDKGHPHVHLTVKAMNERGIKLDPKKADLHRWRQILAAHCRDNGIQLEASYCSERGVAADNPPSKIYQARRRLEEMKDSLEIDKKDKKLLAQAVKVIKSGRKIKRSDGELKLQKNNIMTRQQYRSDAKVLSDLAKTTNDPAERIVLSRAAKAVYRFSIAMPNSEIRLRKELNQAQIRDRGRDRDRGD